VLLSLKPLTFRLSVAANDVVKTIGIKVRNADILPSRETPGHTVRLTVTAGSCPPAIIDAAPDFDVRTPGDQDTVLLRGGRTKKARVRLHLRASDFLTHNHLAPARCSLAVTASTELEGNADPVPSNNSQPLEINIIDASDAESSTTHESLVQSARPLRVRIRDGAASATRSARLRIANADVVPSSEAPGHPVQLSLDAAATDCPSGSILVDQPSPLTLAGGARTSVRVTVNASSAAFVAGNAKSPARCTAVLQAVTDVAGNAEPDATNNSTRLVIEVDDKNDY
jgi:hypothetical protein